MDWEDALKVLRRAAQVTGAKPDDPPGEGWVEFKLFYYENGEIARMENHRVSQVEFESFLRTGKLQENV